MLSPNSSIFFQTSLNHGWGGREGFEKYETIEGATMLGHDVRKIHKFSGRRKVGAFNQDLSSTFSYFWFHEGFIDD